MAWNNCNCSPILYFRRASNYLCYKENFNMLNNYLCIFCIDYALGLIVCSTTTLCLWAGTIGFQCPVFFLPYFLHVIAAKILFYLNCSRFQVLKVSDFLSFYCRFACIKKQLIQVTISHAWIIDMKVSKRCGTSPFLFAFDKPASRQCCVNNFACIVV